jgi:hypothetical protein
MTSPWVIAAPEYVAAAASDLANIGSSLSTANMAALLPTSGVLAAGADEVSAMIAALFSSHAQAYQALSAQAASFHAQFVQLMNTGATQYALQEAANASPLLETLGQDAAGAVNSSISALTGVPLAGGGAAAAPVVGGNSASAASFAKPTPAASVPIGGVTPLSGTAASSASNFAATGGSGGSGGLLPSSAAAAVANPVATSGLGGAGGSGSLLSSSAAINADGADTGMAGPPVASPLLNTVGTTAPNAAPLSGSGGVSETSGNGGTGRLGSEAAASEEGSASVPQAGDGGGAAGTFGELRASGGSFYGSDSGDGTGTGAAAAFPS